MLVRSSTGTLKVTSLWSSLELALCTRFCVLASHVSVLFTIIPSSFVWLTISITSPSILNLAGKLVFFWEIKKSLNWFSSCLAAFYYKRYAYSGTHTHTHTHTNTHTFMHRRFSAHGGRSCIKTKDWGSSTDSVDTEWENDAMSQHSCTLLIIWDSLGFISHLVYTRPLCLWG